MNQSSRHTFLSALDDLDSLAISYRSLYLLCGNDSDERVGACGVLLQALNPVLFDYLAVLRRLVSEADWTDERPAASDGLN